MDTVEQDGILFQMIPPEPIIHIPSKASQSQTCINYKLNIINQSNVPRMFIIWWAVPEILQLDYQPLKWYPNNVNGVFSPQKTDFPTIQPGKRFCVGMRGYFFWFQQELWFRFGMKSGQGRSYRNLQPGSYLFRIVYWNQYPTWQSKEVSHTRFIPSQEGETSNSDPDYRCFENIWIGEIATPPVEIRLV